MVFPLFPIIPDKISCFFFFFKISFICFQRGEGRGKEKHCSIAASQAPPYWGPATQACALTGSQTSDPLVRRQAFSPLRHTSQGQSNQFLTMSLYPHSYMVTLVCSMFLLPEVCFVFLIYTLPSDTHFLTLAIKQLNF